jgi:hypothetical protein
VLYVDLCPWVLEKRPVEVEASAVPPGVNTVRVLRFFLLVLVLVVSLGGCEELFEFNLFASLEAIDLPDAEALNSMSEEEALDYLCEELESDAFVDALAEDQQALNDVEMYLNDHRGTANDHTEKRATILYADLQLKVYRRRRTGQQRALPVARRPAGCEFQRCDGGRGFLEDSPSEACTAGGAGILGCLQRHAFRIPGRLGCLRNFCRLS